MSARRILIPVDGSKNSERALKWYVDNFHRENDEIVLLHGFENPSLSAIDISNPGAFPHEQWQKLITERMKEVNDIEANFTIAARNAKVKYEYKSLQLREKKPGEAICQAASELKVDHILMGSRGLGKLRRTFLGSVSDYVLHHAGLPITIVPPEN